MAEERPARLDTRPTGELVREVTDKATTLARKEVELARLELRANLQRELNTARDLGVGAVLALLGAALLLVALALALARLMPAWLAALLVAGALLLAAAIAFGVGWAKRVRRPLPATRRTLVDDLRWAKERFT